MNPRANPAASERPSAAAYETPLVPPTRRRLFRRGPWENAATAIIALGVFMLMQPFALSLFTWSFVTILTGTILFVIVSPFRE
jgi:hypothetical protein